MRILHVVGARPNFMKVAPVLSALSARNSVVQTLVHTGQHYDQKMSDVFFNELGLPRPDTNLGVGSGTHATQTAQIMVRFEQALSSLRPDLVLVYGDVNSTVAAAIVCAKQQIPVCHVEAGLRSFDRTMPEEINRLLTDQICDLLFTPSADADTNLMREGVAAEKIHRVGNVMIDTLVRLLPLARKRWDCNPAIAGWRDKEYALVTLHRPSNVDSQHMLTSILQVLSEISGEIPVIFPIHPRTRQRLSCIPDLSLPSTVHVTDPLSYLDFLAFQSNAALVITDSGGIQEETTYLRIPCLTVRKNTERPITVTIGSNTLVGEDLLLLRNECSKILNGNAKQGQIPPLWDGRAGERIAAICDQRC